MPSMKKLLARNTEVGTFIFCDPVMLERYGGRPIDIIPIQNGLYHCDIDVKSIGGFFKPDIKASGIIEIKSGRLFAGDPSSAFKNDKKWQFFLNSTRFLKIVPYGSIVVDTGGDGMGEISINLRK
jgi:hypothetical protein